MATAKQAGEIIDESLRLPAGTTRWLSDHLRANSLLPSTQGRAEPIGSNHIATMLLAALLGGATRVGEYAALRERSGRRLADTLGDFLDRPDSFLELRIDLLSPRATIVSGDMHTSTFTGDDGSRPAFERFAVLDFDTFNIITAAIRGAPPVRHGRRRTADRYRRVERVVIY